MVSPTYQYHFINTEMYTPLVSIQIPTYNQQEFIKEALDSALAQTYENLQVIVSDDCSPTYDIFEYLQDYVGNPKVLIHRNEKNLGRVGNYRNTLYNLVEGEWFVNLDADDYFIDVHFISTAIKSISKAEDVCCYKAYTNIEKIKKTNCEITSLDISTLMLSGQCYLDNIKQDFGFTHASVLFNTGMAKKNDFYNTDVLDVDYFSFLKILKKGNIIVNANKVYEWRIHEAQATNTLSFDKVLSKYEALKDLKHYLSDSESAFYVTEKNVYLELLRTFQGDQRNMRNLLSICRKTHFSYDYIKPLISTFKYIALH